MAKGLGVSAASEMCYDLTPNLRTRCVVVATDGVFEFMSSAETMAIAEKFYEEDSPNACEQAAHAIVRAAYTKWQEQDPPPRAGAARRRLSLPVRRRLRHVHRHRRRQRRR